MVRLHTHAQHFLHSPRFVAELIGHSNIRKNDIVYDLGAGSGVIASILARRCRQVFAVENEPHALAKLRANVGHIKNITICNGDILKLKLPDSSYKVFSNIPFSLSSAVVKKLTEAVNPPASIYLIVQKQFGRKLVPGDNHFTGQLGAEIAPLFAVRIRRTLKKTDFTPPPNVDTVLLEIKLRDEPLVPLADMPRYREFVIRCFTRQAFFASLERESAGVSAELRPSQLTPDQWLSLFTTKGVK